MSSEEKMNLLKIFVSIIFLTSMVFGQSASEKIQKTVELFVSAYNDKNYPLIEQQFNAQMKAAITTEKLKEFLDNSHRDLGKIVLLGKPKFVAPMVAVYPTEFERGKMELLIALDAAGEVGGLRIAAPQPEKPKNTSRNKTKLILPFKGEWLVFWGGDTPEQNYHQEVAVQRFAFDILKVDASGKTHTGDGTKNEDYYAFGQELVAPADGVVTDVVSGVRDNAPNVRNPLMAVGNMVMIRHADGEVSMFAHLKFGSPLVKVGQSVKKGQIIGLCGNSGNSTEAHLHYQLQETNLFEAEGTLKVFFEKIAVKRDGKIEMKNDYSPVKDDLVSQN